MPKREALGCFLQGMQLLHADRLDEVMNYYIRAIELGPQYAEAYPNRREIFNLQGWVVVANSDLRKGRSLAAGAAGSLSGKITRKVEKVDLKGTGTVPH